MTDAPVMDETWPPDPPDEVLLELGRILWAAINLEDLAEIVCSSVLGAGRREPTGKKIKSALNEISSWVESPAREAGAQWLQRAQEALTLRHSIFHAVPGEGFLPYDDGEGTFVVEEPGGMWLQFFPRGGRGHPPRMLTSTELLRVREQLMEARREWIKVVEDLDQATRPQKT
jgi:hypothetical protein